MLTLGDTEYGLVSAEGGDISAPVIREVAGGVVRKRLGTPAPEPIVLSFDLSLHPEIYHWIAEFWRGDYTPRSGSLISLDMNGKAQSELFFENAVISTTTIPAMDAASKTPCTLTVQLAPERTRRTAGSGAVVGFDQKPKQPWLPSFFDLAIEGLDTKRVSRIDPLTVVADERGAIDFPDLHVLLSPAGAEEWFAWHDEFVVSGHADKEKSGLLTFFARDLRTKLGRLKLDGLGITRLAPEPAQKTGVEQVVRLGANLYCESMELAVP